MDQSCTGPIAVDVQNMNSEQSDAESAQSDGWVMDQNSFSSEQSSDSSVASDDEINLKPSGPTKLLAKNSMVDG